MFDQAITWGTISSLSIVILRSKHCRTSPTCLPGGVEAPAAAAEAGHVGAHVGLGGVRAPLARAGEHPLRPQHCRDQYFGICSIQKYSTLPKKYIEICSCSMKIRICIDEFKSMRCQSQRQ